jgi:hypothetical protein
MKDSEISWPEIKSLQSDLFSTTEIQIMEKIFEKIISSEHFDSWRNIVESLDDIIGGKGIRDLLVRMEYNYTGNYAHRDRDIFRSLQYATICFTHKDIDGFLRRDSIQESCEHIEAVLKRKFKQTINITTLPLGQIIKKIQEKQLLDESLIYQLKKINIINRRAKHSYSEDELPDDKPSLNSHMFTVMDVISMYFICRKIGVKLMSNYIDDPPQ